MPLNGIKTTAHIMLYDIDSRRCDLQKEGSNSCLPLHMEHQEEEEEEIYWMRQAMAW